MNEKQSKLVEDNLKIVYKVISKDYPTFIGDEDILQAGMLGLCQAADKWDESKGQFSTYAWRCIRNSICQEFRNRKSHTVVSLESPIGEDLTIGDTIEGDNDVQYIDDSFITLLGDDERHIFDLFNEGYETIDISAVTGYPLSKVQKILRLIRIKWRKFNNND